MQLGLGTLWVVDGLLQLQPRMFTTQFARLVLLPAAQGEPGFVHAVVTVAARLVLVHPAAWDVAFAAIQLALGLGLLYRPTVRAALVGSVVWGVAVWYLGEGLGGVARGQASLLSGAPGAALLYAVLAAGIWPEPARRAAGLGGRAAALRPRAGGSNSPLRALPGVRQGLVPDRWVAPGGSDQPPAAWFGYAWAALWLGAALLQVLPAQASGGALADTITGAGSSGWIGFLSGVLARAARHGGVGSVVLLAGTELGIGASGLVTQASIRRAGAAAGIGVAVLFWVAVQAFGQLTSGLATDPNSALPIILVGLAMVGATAPARRQADRGSREPRWDLSLAGAAMSRR